MRRRLSLALLVSLCPAAACVGDAGGKTVDFDVGAAGPADAVRGRPLAFTQDGWDIVLTQATLHVGAVYLVQTKPASGAQATGCYLTNAGEYVAQETGSNPDAGGSGIDVDLLSPAPQLFAEEGHGVTQPSPLIGQVWLVHGDINVAADRVPMLTVAGTATQNGVTVPFTGSITIGNNHQSSGALAGGDPICKERIVTPISPVPAVETTGGLLLRIDPRALFNFDFGERSPLTGAYQFSDDPMSWDTASQNLYGNLHTTAPYSFSWVPDL
jgi:hypothetical protein